MYYYWPPRETWDKSEDIIGCLKGYDITFVFIKNMIFLICLWILFFSWYVKHSDLFGSLWKSFKWNNPVGIRIITLPSLRPQPKMTAQARHCYIIKAKMFGKHGCSELSLSQNEQLHIIWFHMSFEHSFYVKYFLPDWSASATLKVSGRRKQVDDSQLMSVFTLSTCFSFMIIAEDERICRSPKQETILL